MTYSRRELLGLLALGALAGCAGSEPDRGGDATATQTEPESGGSLPGESGDDSGETSLAGSCASAFGDTMQRYDVGDREMVATFSYPMGGEVTLEQDDAVAHGTVIAYGEGDLSPLHSITVFERGPTGEPLDATEAYEFDDQSESGTITTYGGQERPVVIRRRDDPAVSYIFHADGPDGVYVFDVTTAADEAAGCLETYESVTRRVAESFEPLA
ncbi:hypothetical protein [Haloarcula marina]|uniref:hypothetical protein n=1 Tax=Haloarcula marina TaxID=2961574 RepID=UPI0020B86D81|nr:hypothetical protein [Halomicroarcula marina]